VSVRPQRGAACVFWTMDADGVDASSWHNGARVAAGGGGKWICRAAARLEPTRMRCAVDCRSILHLPLLTLAAICCRAEKFKELPLEHRAAQPLRLPATLPAPALPGFGS